MAPWDKIALIDTENGSGELYSDLGPYSVITLTAPYTPERYIEAIKACEDAGIEVIVIDSVTHEWDGKGGLLESNELIARSKFKGNTWAAWSETTPRHQRFIEAIVTSKCHVITTARSKTDTIQTEDKKIKKVGLKEIQREGFEYELTINFTLDRDGHYATASKDRTGMFINENPFKITKETGAKILEWAMTGEETKPETPGLTTVADASRRVGEMAVQTENAGTPVFVKPPPTATEVMEHLTACVAVGPLTQLYTKAIDRYAFGPEGDGITECFLHCYAKIKKWKFTGESMMDAEGNIVAKITREKTVAMNMKATVVVLDQDGQYDAAETAGLQAA